MWRQQWAGVSLVLSSGMPDIQWWYFFNNCLVHQPLCKWFYFTRDGILERRFQSRFLSLLRLELLSGFLALFFHSTNKMLFMNRLEFSYFFVRIIKSEKSMISLKSASRRDHVNSMEQKNWDFVKLLSKNSITDQLFSSLVVNVHFCQLMLYRAYQFMPFFYILFYIFYILLNYFV